MRIFIQKAIVLFIMIFSLQAKAQKDIQITWNNIEQAILEKKNLVTTQTRLHQIQQQSLAEKDYLSYIRSKDLSMRISDLRSEDTLYFKNSSFIDSLIADQKLPGEIIGILHLLQAKRIKGFASYRRFNRSLYKRMDLPIDYAALSLKQLDSLAEDHFEHAKNLAAKTIIKTENIIWLSDDPLIFLFKPGLADIIFAEQIKYTSENYSLNKEEIIGWLSLSQDEFIKKLAISGSSNSRITIANLYVQWINSQGSKDSRYFIETLARQYVYGRVPSNKEADRIYESYLLKISLSSFPAVRAHAVYQLCLLWKNQSDLYLTNDSVNLANRNYANKALELYEQNKSLLDSFQYLKTVLEEIKQQLNMSTLEIRMLKNNIPNEPILAQTTFKNVGRLIYRLVRVGMYESMSDTVKLANKRLLQKDYVREVSMELPAPPDHNIHRSFLKIDPLKPGIYYLLFSDSLFSTDHPDNKFIRFVVTSIAAVNQGNRVYVLDRKSGFPLENSDVKASYDRKIKEKTFKEESLGEYRVNKEGFITISDKRTEYLNIYYGVDSFFYDFDGDEKEDIEDLYDKEEYANKLEYYVDKIEVNTYLDRSIYRPGQTAYFKAVFFTKDPNTGNSILLTRQNLRSFLNDRLKKWLGKEKPRLYLRDPFNRKIDSIFISPNSFGSMSGTFSIPKNAPTGSWSIDGSDIGYYNNETEFKVEEYKRPTYELLIEKPKLEINPGDSFAFIVKVRSFAGASLNNVKINYTVERYGELPDPQNNLLKISKGYLIDTFGFTSSNGELRIMVLDSALQLNSFGNDKIWRFTYELSVDATDETGEQFKANSKVEISTKPVMIKLPMSGIYSRNDLPRLMISATDINAGEVFKNIKFRIYRMDQKGEAKSQREFLPVDEWIFKKEVLIAEFKYVQFNKTENPERTLVYEKITNTGDYEKIKLPVELLTAGNYLFEARSEEAGRSTGSIEKKITIYDPVENKLPAPSFSFHHLKYNTVLPGDTIKFVTGNSEEKSYSIYYVSYFVHENKKILRKNYYEQVENDPGIALFNIIVPANATDRMLITQLNILDGEVYFDKEDIFISQQPDESPQFIFTRYRSSLTPGSGENFTLGIKSKDNNVIAELMTTMYDASLDKIEKHRWKLPNTASRRDLYDHWQNEISSNTFQDKFEYPINLAISSKELKPLWWLDEPANKRIEYHFSSFLAGRVAGVNVGANALYNVVVTAQGIRRNLSASIVTLRGNRSITSFNQPLIIMDDVPFHGDISKIDPSEITDILVLKGASATSLYGSDATNGVLIISTRGEIQLPTMNQEPAIKVRKDFNETTFFFPNIYADRNGYYQINFTMPETVTQWNWKLLAHTKLAKFIYAEKKISTSLPLMVQPYMPRLLYQGDRIILKSRISNLDTTLQTGKVTCRIEDAITNEDITSSFIALKEVKFSTGKQSNTVAEFELKVPLTQVNPVKIIITASSSSFSDGEEHIIPILSPKILMKESLAFNLLGKDTILHALTLPKDADLYGVGLSIQRLPQASIVNALPYLAEFSINCAEQTFNKLFAYATALQMMRNDAEIRNSYKNLTAEALVSNTEKLEPLLQAEQTMPWLGLLKNLSSEHKQLIKVLDSSNSIPRIKVLIEELYKLQNPDGGITWFKGGKSNFYISCYLLAGFGKLPLNVSSIGIQKDTHHDFITGLLNYCEKVFLSDKTISYSLPLYYLYSRSYWVKDYPLTPALLHAEVAILDSAWKRMEPGNLAQQALLIIITLRNNVSYSSLRNQTMALLNSIQQSAIIDKTGTRWKEISDIDDLQNSSEETLALLFEAFDEAGLQEVQNGILKWLLMAKTEQHWTSTKATAAVIHILSNNHNQADNTQSLSIADPDLNVSNSLLSGTTFSFHQQKTNLSEIKVKKESIGIANGNFIWYYFSSASTNNGSVKLNKKLFRYNAAHSGYEPLEQNDILNIGDKIKVKIIVETPRSLQYVYIDDKRGAGLQPIDNSSGYEYAPGFSYYKSVRDAGFQFFSDYIPAGISELTYDLIVDAEGTFNNGIASLQCMYRPEISAYSISSIITTKK